MKLKDFQMLPREFQINILYQDGVYVGKRRLAKTIILLFQVHSFYVELFYERYRHSIQSIKLSNNTLILDPYMEQIELEHLVT